MQLPSSDSEWYVVRAKAGWEHLAARELREGGFETYLPMRRIRNIPSRFRRMRLTRSVDKHVALMPGYLFLGAQQGRTVDWGRFHDGDDAWRFRHVGRPLRSAMGPLRIPSSIVIKISVDETAGKFDETGATKAKNHEKLEERFAPGTEVRVVDGVFGGFMAMCESVTAQDRIKALVSIFGRLAPCEFAPEQLDEVA